MKSAKLILEGKEIELPVIAGSENELAIDVTKQAGYEDNLIVEAYLDPPANAAGLRDKSRRSSLGDLPAVPIEITRP